MVPALFAQTAENVLLLVNENSEDSKAVARYYAEKRKVPPVNLCRIRTSESESISRSVFEREILQPAADYLKSKGLQDRILYIVTTRGLPLMIEGNDSPSGDLASVDSELALLYRYMAFGGTAVHGRIENPYFAVEFNRDNFRPFIRRDYDIYLVTRLTGATSIDAAQLVDRALKADSGGAYYFDLASSRQSTESEWLQQAASLLKQANLSVTLENTGRVLDNLTGVQGYVNQGSSDTTLNGRIPDIHWSPGAIATVFDKGTARSFAPGFISSGVAGFGAYIGDPTPDGYIRPQILFPAYASGCNLAEAFYAASRYVGWRQMIIGDPLSSPYGRATARQREIISAAFCPGIDAETGLPEFYAKRRQLFLVQKYNTGHEAVSLLLKAEAAADRGEAPTALSLVDRSLVQDPFIVASHSLKAKVLEQTGDQLAAIEEYRRVVQLGKGSRDHDVRLAELVLDKLKDPAKAAPSESKVKQPDPPPVSVSVTPDDPPGPDVQAARVISQTPIEYPREARVSGAEGVAVVSLLIDEMGQVLKGEIVHGKRVLGEAILKSAMKWKFEPRLENGRAVPSRFTLTITFKIEKPK